MKRLSTILSFVAVLAIGVIAFAQRDPILDWVALRGYTPPKQIVALADRTAMTDRAKHLLYVNKPMLDGRDAFNEHCTNRAEESSVILGCFLGDRRGIFIYDVTDKELDGVREVTTAHEMLHQAYERLSPSEKDRIDRLVEQYAPQITDEAIKEQLEIYKKTEPRALNNEMHSLFGTQVQSLPQELEDYYKQYFSDRGKVVGLYNAYRSAFTTRKNQIAAYDAQLQQQKPEIERLQNDLESQLETLNSMRATMDNNRNSGDIESYNRMVASYNARVATYNNGLEAIKHKIATYNEIVAQRNAIADQEQALQRSLSSKSLPESVGE